MLALPFARGYELILEMAYRTAEDQLFMRWITAYQQEMSFEEFKQRLKQPSRESFMNGESEQTAEKTIETVQNILNHMRI